MKKKILITTSILGLGYLAYKGIKNALTIVDDLLEEKDKSINSLLKTNSELETDLNLINTKYANLVKEKRDKNKKSKKNNNTKK